ncbi:hypothetical protein A0H81_02147 [Grifola frondosa]|uniref:Cupin 2 conserved barrel domain-containing protein n=1 Tax=Grifola frondosa TaxID=5627 RepID=A0A1C7MPW1_GRIFR|nr:hypothetical protein A0H81_02147 [Grifola frondosa]
MTPLTRRDAERQVRSWGFSHVYTWTDTPNSHYSPHSHLGLTTHLVLSGEFTVTYTEDDPNRKETFWPGARIDVPAEKVHEVWIGEAGCTYVIGEQVIGEILNVEGIITCAEHFFMPPSSDAEFRSSKL